MQLINKADEYINLMQTPYEILQLKQKKKRRIISQMQKERAFSVKSSKSGTYALQYHIEKEKPSVKHRYDRKPCHSNNQNKLTNSQKKYEIMFRESIRKVNEYRTRVYHTHNALKRQNFVSRLIATAKQTESPRQKHFTKKFSAVYAKNTAKQKAKTYNPEKQFESLNLGKYQIFFKLSPQKGSQNQIIPEISVQKCKLNLSDNENKHKIQRTIQSLYDQNRKLYQTTRKGSIDSFTERGDNDNLSEETHPKNITMNFFDHKQPVKITIKSPGSTKYLKSSANSINKGELSASMKKSEVQNIDDTKVANFIRKKKKRLPISTLRTSKAKDNPESFFKRTVTDNFSNRVIKQSLINNPHQKFFSPGKFSRCGARIKFNSIEENLSGWQFQPCQNGQIQAETKSPVPLS